MKKTKLTEKDYNLFYKSMWYGNINDPIESAIRSAYRDLCRTIHGFSKNEYRSQIYDTAKNILYSEIKMLLNANIRNQNDFDKWHEDCCEKMIVVFGEQTFYYGQAQKWINMSLKYISMFEHKLIKRVYEYCHVPIDNYILEALDYSFQVAWSRIDNYDEYLKFQQYFRNKYKGIPLDEEFKIWLKTARKVGE